MLEVQGRGGEVLLAVVLEVQLGEDPRKKLAWPVYVTVLRARKRCPAYVLVIAPDEAVAAWAAQPIPLDLDPDGSMVLPRVLGPRQIPGITDPAATVIAPELGVLSARAHGNDPDGPAVLLAAVAGLATLDRTTAAVYFHIIYEALREPARRVLRAIVMEQRKNFPRLKDLPLGREIAEMFRPVLEWEYREEGKLEGLREALLELARHAGLTLSAEDQARVEVCSDVDTLKRWIDNALRARSAEELLA